MPGGVDRRSEIGPSKKLVGRPLSGTVPENNRAAETFAIDVLARKRMFGHSAPPVRAISRGRTVSR